MSKSKEKKKINLKIEEDILNQAKEVLPQLDPYRFSDPKEINYADAARESIYYLLRAFNKNPEV